MTPATRPLPFAPPQDGWAAVWIAVFAAAVFYAMCVMTFIDGGSWWINGEGAPADLDFVSFWTAARLAAEGQGAAAYDAARLAAVSGHARDYPFFYPPAYLLLIAPLGLLPFGWAAAAFLGGTGAAYLAAARAVDPRPQAVALAAAAPAAFFNIYVGQNGLLTAALFGGALALLDRRPVAAGLLLAALAFKPQFGVLIPLVLAATGRWRVFAAAAAGVVALNMAAGAALGWDVFPAFLDNIGAANGTVLSGAVHPWKVQTVYGAVRWLTDAPVLAWTAHGLFAAAVAAALVVLWRSEAPYAVKAAALPVAALLASPYGFSYDAAVLAVPVLFLVADGRRTALSPFERAALTLGLLLPLATLVVPAPMSLAGVLAVAAAVGRRWLAWRRSENVQATAGSAGNSALPA